MSTTTSPTLSHRRSSSRAWALLSLVFIISLIVSACALPSVGTEEASGKDIAELATTSEQNDTSPIVPEAMTGFSLYDLESSWTNQNSWKGALSTHLATSEARPTVLAFVYSNCGHTCPQIILDMKRIESELPSSLEDKVGFALISLDPSRDTPERLAEFAGALRLDTAKWTLLTSSASNIREIAALLGVSFREEGEGEITHSNRFVVLSPDGEVIHVQDGLDGNTAPTLAALTSVLP